jgi:hypothetical protein
MGMRSGPVTLDSTRTNRTGEMRNRSRAFLAMASLLALLLPALSPLVARAETSNEKVYHLGPPGLESVGTESNGESETPGKDGSRGHTKPKPHRSATPGTGEVRAEAPTEPEGEPESGEREESRAATPGKGGNHPPGDGSGAGDGASSKTQRDGGHNPGRSSSPGSGGSAPTDGATSKPGSGGGSSPVVPILIAVVVLAAISIGVVLYRERKQNSGPDAYHPRSG